MASSVSEKSREGSLRTQTQAQTQVQKKETGTGQVKKSVGVKGVYLGLQDSQRSVNGLSRTISGYLEQTKQKNEEKRDQSRNRQDGTKIRRENEENRGSRRHFTSENMSFSRMGLGSAGIMGERVRRNVNGIYELNREGDGPGNPSINSNIGRVMQSMNDRNNSINSSYDSIATGMTLERERRGKERGRIYLGGKESLNVGNGSNTHQGGDIRYHNNNSSISSVVPESGGNFSSRWYNSAHGASISSIDSIGVAKNNRDNVGGVSRNNSIRTHGNMDNSSNNNSISSIYSTNSINSARNIGFGLTPRITGRRGHLEEDDGVRDGVRDGEGEARGVSFGDLRLQQLRKSAERGRGSYSHMYQHSYNNSQNYSQTYSQNFLMQTLITATPTYDLSSGMGLYWYKPIIRGKDMPGKLRSHTMVISQILGKNRSIVNPIRGGKSGKSKNRSKDKYKGKGKSEGKGKGNSKDNDKGKGRVKSKEDGASVNGVRYYTDVVSDDGSDSDEDSEDDQTKRMELADRQESSYKNTRLAMGRFMLLYGGWDNQRCNEDVYMFNPKQMEWSKIKTEINENENADDFVVDYTESFEIGGGSSSIFGKSERGKQETKIYQQKQGQRMGFGTGLGRKAGNIRGRRSHSAVVTGAGDEMYVFGGGGDDNSVFYNDLWILDTHKMRWSRGYIEIGIDDSAEADINPELAMGIGDDNKKKGLYVHMDEGEGEGEYGIPSKRRSHVCFFYKGKTIYNTQKNDTSKIGELGEGEEDDDEEDEEDDDDDEERMYLFGGGNGKFALNDLYKLVPINHGQESRDGGIRRFKWVKLETKGAKPPPRGYHTANVYNGDQVLVYGGSADGTQLYSADELYVLDMKTLTWTRFKIGGNGSEEDVDDESGGDSESNINKAEKEKESEKEKGRVRGQRRLAHSAVVVGPHLFIIMGHNGMGYSNGVQILRLDTLQWVGGRAGERYEVRVGGDIPMGRGYHTAVYEDGKIYLYGGYDGNRVFDEMYVMELSVFGFLGKMEEKVVVGSRAKQVY